jgi:NAD(P)-dependent dehydrogenase (short-subunit alcohol dehydrogenase family)
MTNLVGKSAVVAAGAKNLGGLISTSLAEKGVNVAVHYNSPATEPDADKTVAAVQDAGVKAPKARLSTSPVLRRKSLLHAVFQ